jgi:hypothetical protein
MPDISQEELDELRARAGRTEQAEAAEKTARTEQAQAAAKDQAPTGEYLVPHRALLADGTVHDYEGAHPTHVSKTGDGGREVLVPVMAVYPTA